MGESESDQDKSRAQRDVIAGFEDGRDQKPRDTAASKDCKRQGSRFTPRVSSYFFPVRLVLDF